LYGKKIVGFLTDRARAMTNKNNGIATKLKNKMKEFEGSTSAFDATLFFIK
jgi:hypothetical protein